MAENIKGSNELETDRVSDLHVADLASNHPLTASWRLDIRKTLLSSRLSFSPPAMAVFPLAFIVLSLSLLVCAADLYKVLQGQAEVPLHLAYTQHSF